MTALSTRAPAIERAPPRSGYRGSDLVPWDFLRETGLPMKPWRAVLTTLVKLGVKKYQADWREPTGDGPTPVVIKISKRRRAKVVPLAAVERKRA